MKLSEIQFGWSVQRKLDASAMLVAALEAVLADGLADGERPSFDDAVLVAEALLLECGKTQDASDVQQQIEEMKR